MCFVHLDFVRELSHFFDVIYVPRSVHMEVNRKGRFRYTLRKLYDAGLLHRCATADRTNLELRWLELGDGEAEALVQAQERHADFFIGDDKRAREIAEAQGLKPVGTVRILARLELEGRADKTKSLVKKLRTQFDFRVSDKIVTQAIAMANEPL